MPVPAVADDSVYGTPCDFNHQYNELEHWVAWSGGYVRRIETSGVVSPWVRLQTADGKPLEHPRIRPVPAEGLFLQAQGLGFFLPTVEPDKTPTAMSATGDLSCTPRLQPLTPGQLYFERTGHRVLSLNLVPGTQFISQSFSYFLHLGTPTNRPNLANNLL